MVLILLLVSSLALFVVSLVMLVRANDLGWRPGKLWMVRRVGFILAGTCPWALIYADWIAYLDGTPVVTWYHVLNRVGLAMVFTTTPYMPPFWEWITGRVNVTEYSQEHHPGRRATDKGAQP